MKDINYQKLIKKAENKKFNHLYQVKPFLSLPSIQRKWLNQYYKIKEYYDVHFNTLTFPLEIPPGPIFDPPWYNPDHYLNTILNDVINLLEETDPSWKAIQKEPLYIFCNHSPLEGCDHCKQEKECKLKKKG